MAFECGICTSMFNAAARQPLILECGHTFCRECIQHNLGPQRWCPYCRQPIHKHVDDLPRNYALENAMEAANVPLMDLMDRWGLANAERMMVKPDQLQLVNLISRKGNSGEVWRGTLWGKAVAIKLLPLVGVDERQLDCLRREVAVLLHTTGECKQVCIYKGFCVKGGNFAIIMKLYNYSLAARVARHPGRRLPLPLALKYSVDIAKGLVELHRLGVTAADLKPDNVLIDDELGDAVIADFGISSVVTCSIGGSAAVARAGRRGREATRSSGVLRGTPNYMAPEQFTPGHRPTNKVDIWGFAATLLHMITGAPPWAQDTLLQICTAVGVAKQAPPLPEGLPQQLENLMRSCFEADPAKRPTAVYMLKALQAMGPVLERPQLMRTTAHLARNSQLLAAARGVLVGLQQDCCQLVQQMKEREAAEQAAGTAGGPAAATGRLQRLQAVAEEDDSFNELQNSGNDQQREQEQEQQGQGADAGPGYDQQAGLDQYLAQIGLLPLISQESSLGAPSAPPLFGSSSVSSSIAGSTMAAAASGGSGLAGHLGQTVPYGNSRGSSRSGSTISSFPSRSPNTKLPKVLWTEEEAIQEEQEQQQQRRQQQQMQQQGVAASMGFTSPKRQPQHMRSASEQVMVCGGAVLSFDPQQQCHRQQQRPSHDGHNDATSAEQDAFSPKQHQRSASEGFEVWGAKQHSDKNLSSRTQIGSRNKPPGHLATQFEGSVRSSASSSGAVEQYQMASIASSDKLQQQKCGQDRSQEGCQAGPESQGRLTPGRQRQQWQIPAAAEGPQQQQQHLKQRTKEEQVRERAQQQIAAMFAQTKWPGSRVNSSSEQASAASAEAAGPLTAGAAAYRSHTHASAEQQQQCGSCDAASSPMSSPRKHQRTLSTLLLGRGGAGSSNSTDINGQVASNSSNISPDRLRRNNGNSTSILATAAAAAGIAAAAGAASAVATAAGAAFATSAAAGGAGAAAGAAFGLSKGATEAGKVVAPGVVAALASRFSGGSSSKRSPASPKAAAAAQVPSSPSKTSRWRALFGGSPARKRPQQPKGSASPTAAGARVSTNGGSGTYSSSSSAGVSPGRRCTDTSSSPGPNLKQQQQQEHQTLCSALGTATVSSVQQQRYSGGQLGAYGAVPPAAGSPVPKLSCTVPTHQQQQQQQQHSNSIDCGSSSCTAVKSQPGVKSPSPTRARQPGTLAVQDSAIAINPIKTSSCSKDGADASPVSPAAAAVAAAVAAVAQPDGTCSPLKAHVRKLSLPVKLQGFVLPAQEQQQHSTNSTAPAAAGMGSPKHSACSGQQQQVSTISGSVHVNEPAAAGASRPCSNSLKQLQSQTAGRIGTLGERQLAGAGVSLATASATGNSSTTAQPRSSMEPSSDGGSSSDAAHRSGGGGSHSQLLAEANQLEGLARQLSLSGRKEEAETALRSALAIFTQQLGTSHPSSIAASTRLALCLNRNGKASEAEGLFRQVLTHRQAILGRRHPQVASAANNLAACLYGQGKYAAAAKMYAAALEARKATLGEEHPDTAACMNNLALCKSRLGEYAEAEPLYQQALSIRATALGQSHPDVAATAHQLGHCLSQQSRHSEALVFHKQCLWVRQQQQQQQQSSDGGIGSSDNAGSTSGGGGRNSSGFQDDVLAAYRSVAVCLAQLGCDSQAEEHLEHVLETRTAEVLALHIPPPPGHDSVGAAAGGNAQGRHSRQASFAATTAGLNGVGDDGVDWSVLEDGDARLSKQQQDALLAMASAAEELGRCYTRQGKHSDAEELYWQALEARSQVLGARHELVQATEEQLRECLDRQC